MLPLSFFRLLVSGTDDWFSKEISNFDIIHMEANRLLLSIKCSSWANKMEIPYVISVFGNLAVPNNPLLRTLKALFDYFWGRRLISGARTLLVQTPHEVASCLPYHPTGKIVDMLLPVDLTAFECLPPRGIFKNKYGIDTAKGTILFLGRIHKYKGLRLLVETFAQLLKQGRNYHLVIAGADQGYKMSIVKLVMRLGIAGMVTFTGPIFGKDKLEAYVDADVFVATPTVYEETSLATLEACACYTPVIVTDHNAIPWLEEYEAGFQIRHNKVQLGEALVSILDDNSLRKTMGQNARRLVEEKYALASVTDRLENLFVEIVQSSAAKSSG